MADYNSIIDMIQAGHSGAMLEDGSPKLILDATTRKISAEYGFENVVGITNEINSSKITFSIPATAEGHVINECDFKVVKWINTTSGERGVDNLIPTVQPQIFEWIIPPEAMTHAGPLKVALSFYDIDEVSNSRMTYLWNSLPYSGLRIEQGMDEVSINPIPDSSIVYVDVYTRKISVPSTLHTTIGMVGEYNTYLLRIRCDRYYFGKDFMDEGYNPYIVYYQPSLEEPSIVKCTDKRLIPGTFVDSNGAQNNGDLIELLWPIEIGQFTEKGAIEFVLQFAYTKDGEEFTTWKSNPNSTLNIGKTLDVKYNTGNHNGWKTITVFGDVVGGDGIEVENGRVSLADDLVFTGGDASAHVE